MDLQLRQTALDINIGGPPVTGTPAVSRTGLGILVVNSIINQSKEFQVGNQNKKFNMPIVSYWTDQN